MGHKESYLDVTDLEFIKDIGGYIEVEVNGVSLNMASRGRERIFALSVQSSSMLQIRYNLVLKIKPEELNLHISQFDIDV